jgi:hypothetical protein
MARVRVYGKLIRVVRCGFCSQQLPQVPSPVGDAIRELIIGEPSMDLAGF